MVHLGRIACPISAYKFYRVIDKRELYQRYVVSCNSANCRKFKRIQCELYLHVQSCSIENVVILTKRNVVERRKNLLLLGSCAVRIPRFTV